MTGKEITEAFDRDIASLQDQVEHADGLPVVERCPGTLNEEGSEYCDYCPYWRDFMHGGCCGGLRRAAVLAHCEWSGSRMSTKRYRNRLQTLLDWIVRVRDESAVVAEMPLSLDDQMRDVLTRK